MRAVRCTRANQAPRAIARSGSNLDGWRMLLIKVGAMAVVSKGRVARPTGGVVCEARLLARTCQQHALLQQSAIRH